MNSSEKIHSIAIILKNKRNEKLLFSELNKKFNLIVIKKIQEIYQPFDLGIIDGPKLKEFERRIFLRKHEEAPLFLPFLLITSRKDIGYVTKHLWKIIDELVFTPIEKIELLARIEILLRARRYSLDIKNRLDEIEVLIQALGHDLKAPLRSIKTLTGFIKEDCLDILTEKHRFYLERVISAAQKMEEIQEAIFIFLKAGKEGILKEKIHLESLIRSILDELKAEIKRRKARITIKTPYECISDRLLIKLILKNLIENAIKYVEMDKNPQIEILCKKEVDGLLIEVKDNGPGIPEDKRDEIFKPFVRLHHPEKYPGTGLGLSIVKKCAELLGGRVGVKSNKPEGSIFWVKIPCEVKSS